MPTRAQVIIWQALLVAAVLVSLANYSGYQLGRDNDALQYTILARSLVHSPHYGMINAPGEPAVAKYPFGYPLLLAPSVLLFPDSIDALKILSLLATVVNATILFWAWRWFSRSKSSWWGLAISGLYLLSPLTIDFSRRVMSEAIFTTFCLLAILLAELATRGKQSRWWSLEMSVVMVLVIFTRTVGIVVMGSIFIYLLTKKGRRFWKEMALIVVQMAMLVGLVVAATPVQLRDLLPSEYLKDQSARLLVAPFEADSAAQERSSQAPVDGADNAVAAASLDQKLSLARWFLAFGVERHIGRDIRVVALPFGGGANEREFAEKIGIPSLPLLFGFLVSGIVFLGLARAFAREGLSPFLFVAVLYIGALFLWHWDGERLLYPVQPQIQLGFLMGVEAIILRGISIGKKAHLRPSHRNLALMALVLAVMAISTFKSVYGIRVDDSRLDPEDLTARSAWLMGNSAPSDVVMTEEPELDYLYTGRKTVGYPAALRSGQQLADYLRRKDVDYVLVAADIYQSRANPVYGSRTTSILPAIAELASSGQIKLVHSVEQELLMVFQMQR